MPYLTIKQGDTLYLPCTEESTSLVGVEITSAVKLGGFYKALTVSDIDTDAGTFVLEADTALWPIGSHECDIKYDGGASISHTGTFEIIVIPRVTK